MCSHCSTEGFLVIMPVIIWGGDMPSIENIQRFLQGKEGKFNVSPVEELKPEGLLVGKLVNFGWENGHMARNAHVGMHLDSREGGIQICAVYTRGSLTVKDARKKQPFFDLECWGDRLTPGKSLVHFAGRLSLTAGTADYSPSSRGYRNGKLEPEANKRFGMMFEGEKAIVAIMGWLGHIK